MPYEFKYGGGGINISHPRYQPFLREFVIAVEAAGLERNVALMLKSERHLESGSLSGRRDSLIPEGTVGTSTREATPPSANLP